MKMNLFQLIQNQYENLTRSSKKIANFVLANKSVAQYMSITTMAEACRVAEASITRFCKSLGFRGYNDFKLALAKATIAEPLPESFGVETNDDPFSRLLSQLREAHTNSLMITEAQVNEEDIRQTVEAIIQAKRVYCFGQGGSLILAMEAWARFVTVSSKFITVEDAHLQAMTIALAEPGDVVLFFSYSGATRDMQDLLQTAKAREVKIVLITRYQKSPGSSLADIILLTGVEESPLQGGSVTVKISVLYIIDLLFQLYCQLLPEEVEENSIATAEAVSQKLL